MRFNLAMGRSLRFGSAPRNLTPYSDSLSLRLRTLRCLTLLRSATRRFIMQKARGQTAPTPKGRFGPPTACRRMISGTISLSVRSSFHLSLTVLVHYRSSVSIQPWEMVLPDSHWIPRVLRYLGTRSKESHHLSSTGLAPSVVSRSRTVRLGVTFVTLRPFQH
jgi:hypothetical protein